MFSIVTVAGSPEVGDVIEWRGGWVGMSDGKRIWNLKEKGRKLLLRQLIKHEKEE